MTIGPDDGRSAIVHGTALALNDRGILLLGQPGSGKSDLALRLIDSGAKLIADDAVLLTASDKPQLGRCLLSPLAGASGKLMVGAIGIVKLAPACVAGASLLSLAVNLDPPQAMPTDSFAALGQWQGLTDRPVPLIHLQAFEISSVNKVILALGRWGF